ncbi:polysaccharide pyruvyl transferase family protein [Thiohalophilus sp.]|uniref:polysaccharide pyruvyl transferase family protein n=1 Tax=Thiohalophilus sp. TaxID=3028392 RepID=UPI002ACDDA3F|nr:polysaccharide pyruvyl transferase family protein [Thiohalophilus sp.]MDZ7661054.1 polysaccharide pyruvyl transferase family protein [Thiohalophilus sp.]
MAGKQFFSSNNLGADLCVTQHRTHIGKLKFKRVRSACDLKKYDQIIYWGDFQNNPMWGGRDFARREIGNSDLNTVEEAFEYWKEFYLELGKQLPESTKIYSFGNCFLGMNQKLEDPGTKKSFEYFLQRTDGIVVRDTGSYQLIKSLFSELSQRVYQGYDVSSLLQTNTRPSKNKEPYFVWSFGRSDISADEAQRLVQNIESKLGIKAINIDWLKPELLFGLRHFFHGAFKKILNTIANSSFVLTDIYHMTLNCYNLRTPVIGIYKESRDTVQFGTLNDEKKKMLFEMVDGADFIFRIHGDEITAAETESICKCAKNILERPDFPARLFQAHKNRTNELENLILELMGFK